jgi:hypothetical protein
MLGIGIKGAVWGTQALLSHRKPDRGASLVNMASPVAERGYPNTAIYSAVKGALVTLTKTLSAELGPQGVRVNALAPGSVPTPGALGLNDKAEYERRARTIPLRRLGHEDDVADAIAFLLSPAAAFINGEILHIDGGIAAGWTGLIGTSRVSARPPSRTRIAAAANLRFYRGATSSAVGCHRAHSTAPRPSRRTPAPCSTGAGSAGKRHTAARAPGTSRRALTPGLRRSIASFRTKAGICAIPSPLRPPPHSCSRPRGRCDPGVRFAREPHSSRRPSRISCPCGARSD